MHTITITSTGERLLLPQPWLSASQIEMYLRCPQQYKIRYIDGHKEAPGFAMVEGSAAHSGLEFANQTKIQKGAYPSTPQVIERFADQFTTLQGGIEVWEGETTDSVVKRGSEYLTRYMDKHAPRFDPIQAEHKLEFEVDGIPLLGFSDMEEKDTVWDYKVVGSSRSPKFHAGNMAKSLQLSLYAHATGKTSVGIIGLLRDKKDVKIASASRGSADWAHAKALIVSVARSISAGNFPLTDPTSWICSPRFCGFYPCWVKKPPPPPTRVLSEKQLTFWDNE